MSNDFTTKAAAAFLGVTPSRVRKLIKEGRIPAVKRGRDFSITTSALEQFALFGRRKVGRPASNACASEMVSERKVADLTNPLSAQRLGSGHLLVGDALTILPALPAAEFQMIVADPPYFQVLKRESWDNAWETPDDYLQWTLEWIRECKRVLRKDGLLYIFGQLGKREHVWLHLSSMATREMQFHDMLIWDRAVGYNERSDSFTPQYEMILVLRHGADAKPYFDKDAVRLSYDEETIQSYLKDNRYKDKRARESHLRKGKYATNILRIPSLKGSSKEKIGHPSQKPIALIHHLIASSSRRGDAVLDPFNGSGTTSAAAQRLGRRWTGIEVNRDYTSMAKRRIEREIAANESVLN